MCISDMILGRYHVGDTIMDKMMLTGFSTANYFYDVVSNTTNQFDFKTLLLDSCYYGHFGKLNSRFCIADFESVLFF